jgi:toluene monooxygenase system protein A
VTPRQEAPVLRRDEWHDLARKLDWTYRYVDEAEVFPEEVSGAPWLPAEAWQGWSEPYRTTYAEYVSQQAGKEAAVHAVRDAVGRVEDFARLDRAWLSAEKLHGATLALAELAAVVGNLRAARFGRDSAWRTASALGALDELRHTQIPLLLSHELIRWDRQFDWTHRFFHSDDWVAIAARHLVDEMLILSDPIEFAIATHFVFETGFTNLQFVGLSSVARAVGDRMFERMVQSIQSDEARHAQIGPAVLDVVMRHDPAYAQYLVDKWFWRSWHLFAVVTGFAMDYLTPLAQRTASFKEFMQEWILEQFERRLGEHGLARPWYWEQFLSALDTYHHMVYASAYTYRATVWFDMAVPGPAERDWLRSKYPASWDHFDPIWTQITDRWRRAGPGVEWYTHGVVPVAFCDLCQIVLSSGTPAHNTAEIVRTPDRVYAFCSAPCRWIFEKEPARYRDHLGVVSRILGGHAPANLVALVRSYFGLAEEDWGEDVVGGAYPWLRPRGGEAMP